MWSGSTLTDEEWLAWEGGNRRWVGGGLVGDYSFGSKTGVTWQKCSWRLSFRGSVDRFGMQIARTTPETTPGCSHSWEGLKLRKLGASVRGSSVYSEWASSGSSTSKNSPGQTVLEGVRARRTKALRKVVGGTGRGLGPVCVGTAILHIFLGWPHGNVVCLHKKSPGKHFDVKILDDKSVECKVGVVGVF